MYIIVGLGNPGSQYDTTRHNIGFEVIERFASDNRIDVSTKKFKAHIGQGVVGGEKVILMKPQTYMNLSGESVAQAMHFYKEKPEHVIVVYDDTSLKLGGIRIREKGSAGGHNGVKSLIAHLGTDVFPRVKVGVGEKPPGWDLADYVLSHFTKQEGPAVIDMVEMASKALTTMISEGTTAAMNGYNRK